MVAVNEDTVDSIHVLPCGGFIANFKNGMSYNFNPKIADPSPLHQVMCRFLETTKLVPVPLPDRDLEEVRKEALRAVEVGFAKAVGIELSTVTDIKKAKLEEARDVIDRVSRDDGSPDPEGEADLRALPDDQRIGLYPLLSAGIGIDGADIVSVARLVHDRAMSARARQYELERVRRTATSQIRAASSVAEIHAALAAVSWPAS